MRPFYDTTKEDIDNEINAITKLCTTGAHGNIVVVLRHGWLKSSPYYFIDMELCDKSLEQYIQTSKVEIDGIWRIMGDITNGVAFIHSHKEVHRDLKPRNSTLSSPFTGC